MMRLAFYAPLKPPDHPTPSGDRAMARGLMTALERTGAEVTLASTLRSRDGSGDTALQASLFAQAEEQIARLIPQGRRERWQAWVSYHNYYKAPDLIGPAVAGALGIPYLQVESTRARKRLAGPWADFTAAAESAADAAAVIFYVTARDAETLRRDAPTGQHLIHLRPFLCRDTLPDAAALSGPMLSVGMMRAGDKLASYRIITETLTLLEGDWALEIAGDGPARAEVAALMAPFGDKVRILGALTEDALQGAYARASLLFWPGVNEAFGLTYLEAQAAGLPVVAQNRPGVRDVLAPGIYPAPGAGAAALAHRLTALLAKPELRQAAGAAARDHIAAHHLLPAAMQCLGRGLFAAGVAA
ncbi:glycosyltransferase family 4 protein [Sulfitobacter sp. G21635-S1]|uniref:glycosyltransferase family 4 protein n=1 Tax=Sulfitobacter sp. G21635-S1 TaxID=3014043 RepID=UPI0022AEBFD5|nr:glycosyltransferase family 4 protein [Sulfitobacter sp. G21635-S1]MCZ4258872.1 glycosyltransferase family 4 protein [Sulfitobacter sp. G21635-S1]